MDISTTFGVDTSKLSYDIKVHKERPVVSGRVLHIDGDFVAYFVSASEEISFEEMKSTACTIIEYLRRAAGASAVHIHVTPKDSTKGNRYNIAQLKQYQHTRKQVKPQYLEEVRNYMCSMFPHSADPTLEADDTMSMSQSAAVQAGCDALSVIVSKDKDLNIVPGWHLDWDTHDLYYVPFFGSIKLVLTKTGTKKLVGTGFKFFCAQMLMGDRADSISGLPEIWNGKKFTKCGAVTAYNVLHETASPIEALTVVMCAYKYYGLHKGFKNYSGETIDTATAFQSEAKLLWPRRYDDENDVITLIKEILTTKEYV